MGHKRRLSRLVSQPLADLYPRLRPATSCRHIALGKHTRTGRQAQRRRQTHRLAHTERERERERQKVAGDAPRCRRCAARRIVAAPTTDSRLRSLLAAPSARRVAHRCGARETDCFPCHARAVIEPTRLIRHPVCAGHARAESDVAPCKKKISSNIIWTQSSHRRPLFGCASPGCKQPRATR